MIPKQDQASLETIPTCIMAKQSKAIVLRRQKKRGSKQKKTNKERKKEKKRQGPRGWLSLELQKKKKKNLLTAIRTAAAVQKESIVSPPLFSRVMKPMKVLCFSSG